MPPWIRICLLVITFLSLVKDDFALDEQFSKKTWHSYVYNSGSRNREELKLQNFTLSKFSVVDHIQKWQIFEDKYGITILGLGNDFMQLVPLSSLNDTLLPKTELHAKLFDFVVFQSWSSKSQRTENYVVVTGCENHGDCFIKWYQILDKKLTYLWNWPFNRNISHIDIISFNYELKLLIVSNSSNNTSAEIYSFSINQYFEIWLFDRFSLDDNPSSTSITHCNNNIFLSFAFPKLEMIYVYRYHKSFTGQNNFKLHKKIFSRQVKSFTAHCFRLHYYLAIASANSSVYKFTYDSELVSIMNVDLGSRKRWFIIPINTFRTDILLLGEGDDGTIVVSSGGEELNLTSTLSYLVCNKDAACEKELRHFSAKGAATFFHHEHQYIVFTSRNGESKIINFTVKLEPVGSAVELQLKEMYSFKSLLQKTWEEQGLIIKKLDEAINKTAREFNEMSRLEWKLKNVKSKAVAVSSNPNATINAFVYAHNKNWVDADYSVYLDLLTEPHSDILLNNKINQINSLFNDFENSGHVRVTSLAGLILDNVSFLGSVTIHELELSHLNGIDVDDMLQNSLMLGTDRKIGGVKTVTNIHASDVHIEKLGEIFVDDIVFSDDMNERENGNVINGILVYENDINILEKLEILSGTEGSLFSKLYPFHRGFSFADEVTFDHLSITEESLIQETMNGRPLILPVHNFPFEVMSLGNVYQSRIEKINVTNKLYVELINGQNLSALSEYRSTTAPSDHSASAYYTKNLKIEYLNNMKFPEDFLIVNREKSVALHGEKNFLRKLIVRSFYLENERYLNFSIPRSSRIRIYQDIKIHGDIFSRNINDYSWDALNDILRQDIREQQVTGSKYIRKCQFSKKLNLRGLLNFYNVDDILDTSSNQILTTKSFEEVVFETLNVNGTVGGMNINDLKNSIVLISGDTNFRSNLVFNDEITPEFKNLTVSDMINNLTIFPHNGEKLVVRADMNLKALNVTNLIINGSLTSYNQVNRVNLTDFNLKRLSLAKPQTLRDNLKLENVTVRYFDVLSNIRHENARPHGSRINFDNMYELLRSGSLFVKSVLIKGDVKTLKGVNGFKLTEYKENAIHINRSSAVLKKITFADTVTFNQLKITGRLQGQHLRRLYHDLIYDPSYVFIMGEKNFLENVTVLGKVKAQTLKGQLLQKVMTKREDQSVKGPITIHGNVTVYGNITSYGTINGFMTTDLFKKYSFKHDSYVISNDVVLQIQDIDHLIVEGSVRNKSFSSFVEELVFLSNESYIPATKVFLGPVNFEDSLTVEDTFNLLDISRLRTDILFVNEPSSLEGSLILGKTIMKNLEIAYDFNATLIHGFDTNEWLEESIPLNKVISLSGRKKFRDVHCFGNIAADRINSMLAINIIPLKRQQFIPCYGYFTKLYSDSDISVKRWVNHKILKSEFEDSVLVDEDQEIKGRLIFVQDLWAQNNVILDNVDGRDLSNVITLYTNQTISSIIDFEGTVSTSAVEALKFINGIDVTEWNKRSVWINKAQVITGSWTVRGNITANKRVVGKGFLDATNISDVRKSISKVQILTSDIDNKRLSDFNMQCQRVANFSHNVGLQPRVLHDLEGLQVLKTYVHIESVISFQGNGNYYLAVTFSHDCFSFLYRWNTSKFVFLNHINIGPVKKWMAINYKNSTYLITSSASDVICEANAKKGNIWIFYGNNSKYVHSNTIEEFSDVISSDFPGLFYTLAGNGDVFEWNLEDVTSSKYVVNVKDGKYQFLHFAVLGELAFTNGRHIKNRRNELIYTFSKPHHSQISVMFVNGKQMAVVPYNDEIVIYSDLLQNHIYTSVRASNVNSVLSLNVGSAYPHLVYETKQMSVEIIHIRGANRVVKDMSIPIPAQRLMMITMSHGAGLHPRRFVIVVQDKKIHILEVHFAGNMYEDDGQGCL